MAERVGDTLPAPLRFELGLAPAAGETARAVLFITVGEDGAPRVAVLSPAEVQAVGDRRLRVVLRARSTTADNVRRGSMTLLWCVLDAAAYSICGTCVVSAAPSHDPEFAVFEMMVTDVYRDFEQNAPMIAPPTYRAPSP
jgi:hypothetical protein